MEINHALRRLVDELPIECQFCLQSIKKGDINVHENHCPERQQNSGINECAFQRGPKEEALRHVMENYGEVLREKYKRHTSACIMHYSI